MSKSFVMVICLMTAVFVPHASEAQQAAKLPRIGFLSATSAATIASRRAAFHQGLRELGYIDGKNIIIEYRYAEGKVARLPALAAELVRLKVDAIVTAGPTVTRPAKEATSTIPIIMSFDDALPVPVPISRAFQRSTPRSPGNSWRFSNKFFSNFRDWPSWGHRVDRALRKRSKKSKSLRPTWE
jgi:hypothetical protein